MHIGQSKNTEKIKTPYLYKKGLGVHIDDKLTIHQHVNTSANKTIRILGIIKETFVNRSNWEEVVQHACEASVGIW